MNINIHHHHVNVVSCLRITAQNSLGGHYICYIVLTTEDT